MRDEYICDRCFMEVEANRVLTVRNLQGKIVVEHYCECMSELRVSVFTPNEQKIIKLVGVNTLPYMANPRPLPQDEVERLVHAFVKELDDLSTFNN